MDVSFNTAAIASVIGLAVVLIGFLWKTFRLYNRIETVEKQTSSQKKAIKMLLETQFAILDGLKQLGCNGEVSEAHKKLKKHVIEQ